MRTRATSTSTSARTSRHRTAPARAFTQSIQTFYALDEALDELAEEGGVERRRQIYIERLTAVRRHLEALGVHPLLPEGACSCVLHTFELPAGLTYERLHGRSESGTVS